MPATGAAASTSASAPSVPGPVAVPLEPGRDLLRAWLEETADLATDFVDSLPDAPASVPTEADVLELWQREPGRGAGDFTALLDQFASACLTGMETAGPGNMALVPGGGLVSAAVADLIAAVTNRLTALAANAPGAVALEHGVLRWMCGLFGLPDTSIGVTTSGGSLATLSAVVAARDRHLRDGISRGVMYVSEHTHPCVAKAARIAGLAPDQIRVIRAAPDLRFDTDATAAQIAQDRAAGLVPFLLVATAGSTDTGSVDPIAQAAELAARHGVWLHVDAAYGGFFQLTDRGRTAMTGIDRADSIVLNPHKGLFLPYGTGVLLVRDRTALKDAFGCHAHCLRDTHGTTELPDYADLGPELTRESRGARLWFALHLHGLDAFTSALDEKLDLARHAHTELAADPRLHAPWPPDLATVAFTVRDADDAAHEELLARINTAGRIALSSTRINGRVTLRMCTLNHRTHRETVDEALDLVRKFA